MPYRFATEQTDDSALASGHVLHSAPGRTGFPARLATELFQRCAARLGACGLQPPYVVYDPCCGAGQLLTTIGLLHRASVRELIGSDVDEAAVGLARRNLSLLSRTGLERRIAELASLHDQYGRSSHAAAIADARRFLAATPATDQPGGITVEAFPADITRPDSLAGRIGDGHVDMVVTDVPYGNWSSWTSDPATNDAPPIHRLLETIRPALAPGAVVAIVSGKDQRSTHPAWRRVERWQIGRRRIEIIEVVPGDQAS